MAEYKQVLVLRKDLNMRKGKIGAQSSHASIGALFARELAQIEDLDGDNVRISWEINKDQLNWFLNLSKKIVVYVNSEEDLLDIYNKSKQANLPCVIVKDAGLTEFGGVPTLTAVGIGPACDEDINPITGHLPLF